MSKVFIVAAKRTAVGKFGGSLAAMPAADIAAVVIKDILAETKIDPAKLDEVIVGNILMDRALPVRQPSRQVFPTLCPPGA